MSFAEEMIENRLFVEMAWETCWQVGGIYTVIRSKSYVTSRRWGERYCQLGPYNAHAASLELEEHPPQGIFGRAVELLRERGIRAFYGRRLVEGRPQVVLLDYLASFHRLAEFKYKMWKDHGIDSGDEQEVNDVTVFGYIATEFFECLIEAVREQREQGGDEDVGVAPDLPILAHVHEWMAGVPLLEFRRRMLPVASVFTTHATLLGRYLATTDPNFYHCLPHVDPFVAADAKNIKTRFLIERASAWCATVFTTVSEITGFEAEHFLGRRPDLILPNGLNIQRFAAVHEFQNLHAQYKKKIHEFVMGHFFPSYSFDLDKTLYVFTSGRYEYRNKGLDLFIEGLARLNWRLKCARSGITVVAFIITRVPNKGINLDVLESQILLRDLQKTTNELSASMSERLLSCAAQGRMPTIEDVLDERSQLRLRRLSYAWRRKSFPIVVTHNMWDDSTDPVLAQLRHCNLLNSPGDPVKVVFHPEFLTSTIPLLGMDYDQFVRGTHLGVFPSYYEPWGYTPMECAALGVPSITSDLAGFGTYIQSHIPDHRQRGFFITERRYRNWDDAANQLADQMQFVLGMERRERIDLRNKVESTSVQFDWKELSRYYWESHRLALEWSGA